MLVIVALAAGCGGTSKADSRALDDAVDAIRPSSLGRIGADFRSGSSAGVDDGPSRTIVLVVRETDLDRAISTTTARLKSAGFAVDTGNGEWVKNLPKRQVTVDVDPSAHPPRVNVFDHVVALSNGEGALICRFAVSPR
jgi:hypothetical protein